jgi:septal ring factor EnvC (AmiA/AmiB activator)
MDHFRNLDLAIGSCKMVAARSRDQDIRSLGQAATEIGEWTRALIRDVNDHDKRISALTEQLSDVASELSLLRQEIAILRPT